MASCPICDRHLVDDFGLIECPQCGAALYVEFDGTVRRRDDGPTDGTPPGERFDPPLGLGEVKLRLNEEAEGDAQSADGGVRIDEHVPEIEAAAQELHLPPNPNDLSLGQPNLFSPLPAPEVDENFAEEPLPSPPVRMAEPEPRPESNTGGGDLSDIVEYANSQVSSAREGAYSYDLLISGIDTADLRAAVKEALTDPLFLWDTEGLIREAKSGELKIPKVAAVKAALVVQRLKGLPVDIKWVQHVLFEG